MLTHSFAGPIRSLASRLTVGLAVALGACSADYAGSAANVPFPRGRLADSEQGRAALESVRASTPVVWKANPDCLQDPVQSPDQGGATRERLAAKCQATNHDFVALGLSGGGVKAALFGAETMFYLDALGLLRRAALVSSVSGGSFAAAYYALSCEPADRPCWDNALENGLRRPVWRYASSMATLGHGFRTQVDKGVLNVLVPFAQTSLSADDFAAFIDRTYLGGRGTKESSFLFRHLNPRRPALALNSTLLSGTRGFAEATRGLGYLRRRYADEQLHFAFTDYYFNHIGSDLQVLPLSYGVAASAAFPVLVDFARLYNFRYCDKLRRTANDPTLDCAAAPGYWLTLTDGGANDNQGLIEIAASLGELALGQVRSDRSGDRALQRIGRGDRALILVINSSITEATGVGLPRRVMIAPVLRGVVARAMAGVDAYSAVGFDLRRRLYTWNLEDAETSLRRQPSTRDVSLRASEIALVTLDRYGAGGAERVRRSEAGVLQENGSGGAELEKATDPQVRGWPRFRDGAVRRALGLGDTHPQCLFEQAKIMERPALSLADMNEGNATCLRRAARWATALRADEICQGGRDVLADPTALPCTPIDGRDRLVAPLGGLPAEFAGLDDCRWERTGNSAAENAEIITNLVTTPAFVQEIPQPVRARIESPDPVVRRAVTLAELCTMPQ